MKCIDLLYQRRYKEAERGGERRGETGRDGGRRREAERSGDEVYY
jgi:hypothetical protein